MRIFLSGVAIVLVALSLFGALSPASATVTVTPLVVVIEGRQRYADVNLINTSDKTETYDISWRFFRATEGTGAYQNADGSVTEFDLTKNIILTPKRVTLAPQATQKIRLALRINGEPPAPGDYRAHLEFTQSAPDRPTPVSAAEKKETKVGVSVNVAFSIPVVYRAGDSDVTATMGDVQTEIDPKTGKIIAVIPVTRTGGPFGIMGNMAVFYKPAGGSETLVGEVRNANIFPEANTRNYRVTLKSEALSRGELRIVYSDSNKKKDIIYAERTIPIQ